MSLFINGKTRKPELSYLIATTNITPIIINFSAQVEFLVCELEIKFKLTCNNRLRLPKETTDKLYNPME